MEVLESPNSLDGETHSEEPVTEGEFPATISELLGTELITEPVTDDLSVTTISGDPLNVTESLMNLTETTAVGNESALGGVDGMTVDSVTGLIPIIETNNTELYAENDSIKNDEIFDSLKPEENNSMWSSASVQNGPIPPMILSEPASKNLSESESQFNESGVILKSLREEIGNSNLIQNRFISIDKPSPRQIMNPLIAPVMVRFHDTNSSDGQKIPENITMSPDSIVPPLAVAYALPVKGPELPRNDSNIPIRVYSLPIGTVGPPRNSTLPASTDLTKGLNDQLGSSTEGLPIASYFLQGGMPPINPYAYGAPSQHKKNLEPKNIIQIALPASKPTAAKPTTKKSGFRTKTVLKKPNVKPTQKPKVRKVAKKTPKTTKGKPAASFRSGRKVRTVVKRRFRKVVRRATTTRLVFRRRRRTTRLVRKTTTPRLMTTAGGNGNE